MLLHLPNQSSVTPTITLIKLIQLFPMIHIEKYEEPFFLVTRTLDKKYNNDTYILACKTVT